MTRLYIAIKIWEPIQMGVGRLSKRAQSAKHIISCEQVVLKSLRWRLNGPTPIQFVSYILKLLRDSTQKNLFHPSLQVNPINRLNSPLGTTPSSHVVVLVSPWHLFWALLIVFIKKTLHTGRGASFSTHYLRH